MSLLFFWRCEGTTLDGTHDFTAGDTSATANGSATISAVSPLIGSNSILTAGSASHFRFDSGSIIAAAEGSLSLSFRITTWVANGTLFTIFGSSTDNFIQVLMTGTDELRFQIGSATGPTDISLDTTAANIATGTDYRLIVRWQDSTNSRYIGVFNSSDALISETEDTTTNWVVPTELSGSDRARFGDTGGALSVFRLDNIAIADDYAEPLEDFFQITSYTDYGAAGIAIVDVDEDNTITLEQANVSIDITDGVGAEAQIRQGGFTYGLSEDSASATEVVADMIVIGTTGPVAAPHAGSADMAIVNDDASEDTQAITISNRANANTVLVGTPNADPDVRLDGTADVVAGDYVMWFGVVGGAIGDVTVNDDLTWEADEAVTAFDFQIWDAADGNWGTAATQNINSSPAFASGSGRKRDRRRRGFISPLWGRG